MSNQLMNRYKQFCAGTITDIEKLQYLSSEHLQKEFIPGKWTMIQVVDHLLSIEKGILLYMMKKSNDPALHTVKFKNRFRHFLTKLVLRSGKKIKAPAVVPAPSNEKTIAGLLEEFAAVRTKMAAFIEKWPAENQNKLIFRHPFAGMFTLSQTVDFLGEHWQHHVPQQKELLKHFKQG